MSSVVKQIVKSDCKNTDSLQRSIAEVITVTCEGASTDMTSFFAVSPVVGDPDKPVAVFQNLVLGLPYNSSGKSIRSSSIRKPEIVKMLVRDYQVAQKDLANLRKDQLLEKLEGLKKEAHKSKKPGNLWVVVSIFCAESSVLDRHTQLLAAALTKDGSEVATPIEWCTQRIDATFLAKLLPRKAGMPTAGVSVEGTYDTERDAVLKGVNLEERAQVRPLYILSIRH
jgi:hypothetical protein